MNRREQAGGIVEDVKAASLPEYALRESARQKPNRLHSCCSGRQGVIRRVADRDAAIDALTASRQA